MGFFRKKKQLLLVWFTGYFLSNQHIFSPINPKYYYLCTDFVHVRFTHTNWSKIQVLQVCVNLCKSDKISSVVLFWVNWWKNMLIWQKITCPKGDSIALWTIIGSLEAEGPTALEVFIMQLLWIVKASWYEIPYDSLLSLWIKDRYS